MNTPVRRILATTGCGMLLWVLLAQANHSLASWHVHVWAGGLFVSFAALRLDLREGLASTLLIGLFHDVGSPVPFGLHALLFGIAHSVIFTIRNRFPREEAVLGIMVAVLANLGLFLVFSFTRVGDLPQPGTSWLRLIVDLLLSQFVVIVITPWFLALQERSLEIAGAGLRAEQRGVM